MLMYHDDDVMLMALATSPVCRLNATVGVMEDMGLLPGTMKLLAEDGKPNAFVSPGVEKSSIWSFHRIPVDSDRRSEPKLSNESFMTEIFDRQKQKSGCILFH